MYDGRVSGERLDRRARQTVGGQERLEVACNSCSRVLSALVGVMDDVAEGVCAVRVFEPPQREERLIAILRVDAEQWPLEGVRDARRRVHPKQAAAIVIRDDRFETIAAAVEEGRVVFDNIRKFVLYLFSCNVAEVLVLLIAAVAGLPLPLWPLQLLWLNMITDTFPALALAMEPAESNVMERPPRRPDEAILSRAFLLRILMYGCLITGSTLAASRGDRHRLLHRGWRQNDIDIGGRRSSRHRVPKFCESGGADDENDF